MKQLSTKSDPGPGATPAVDEPSTPEPSTLEPLNLETFLPYRLMMLAEQVSQSLSRLYGERYGLSNPEWRVMAALGQHGTLTSTEIGRNSRMHKTKVSRAVAELESKSLLRRETSRADMRVAHLTLTETGSRTYFNLVPLALQFSDKLAGGLSEAERDVLERVLANLMQRSDAIASDIEAALSPPQTDTD